MSKGINTSEFKVTALIALAMVCVTYLLATGSLSAEDVESLSGLFVGSGISTGLYAVGRSMTKSGGE